MSSGQPGPVGHVHRSAPELSMSVGAAQIRRACPSLGTGTGHDAHVSTGRLKKWACPAGKNVHLKRISGTRLDRVLTSYIESSLALSLGGC